MMELIFLGTSAMVPTKDRNHSAILLTYKNEGILFDCGEGTQRQLRIAGIKPSAITRIIISHWDGDHVLGLPGLIQTLAISEENKQLTIYGPKGTIKRFEHMMKAFEFFNQITLDIKDITKKTFVETDDFEINAYELEHKVLCLGFEFIEKDRRRINVARIKKDGIKEGPHLGKLQQGKEATYAGKTLLPDDYTYIVQGKKIGFISDTRICENCSTIAKDKDILICDSTYSDKHEDKAQEYFHMTARQAAYIAAQGNATKLFLTHFSQRYKEINDHLQEAREIFEESYAAHDFLKVKV